MQAPLRQLPRPEGASRRLASLAVAGLLTLLAATSVAEAQRRTRRAADAEEPGVSLSDLEEVSARLNGEDAQQVREAIELLSVIDDPAVVPPLVELLRSGREDAIVDRALDALGGLGSADAIPVLSEFLNHRRPGARRRAYQALAQIEDARVRPLLERGLRDSDRTIRGTAARALGELGDHGAVEVLFRALERRVPEAAQAIGKLGTVEDLTRFTGFLGREPISVMLSGYEAFLTREDFPIPQKIEIVDQLQEIATRPARQLLIEYEATFPERIRNRQLRQLQSRILVVINRIDPRGGQSGADSEGGAQ